VASLQDIRRRIRSVSNTRKITRALELVAASKLRRAQARIVDMRPYADRMLELMAGTARASASVRGLPLLQQRDEVKTVAIVTVMGDRGLSGAFNSQILRRALAVSRRLQSEGKQVRWVGVGRRGVSSLRFRRFDLAGEFTGFTDDPRYHDAQAIAHKVIELYTNEEVDRVLVIYNRFESALTQTVTEQELLPLSEALLETDEEERKEDALRGDFIFEPEPEQILERLLPVYVETELYRALLESAASKHGAQMTAMRNASKNAGELIDNLTLALNRARQAEITQEILEVVAGADALTSS
jgi:F-type H+-transporting ATPase subunit gamma